MPRQPRIEYEGAIYHVMSRGDQQEAIVEGDEDSGKPSYGDMDPRFQLPPSLATVGKLCQRQGLTPETRTWTMKKISQAEELYTWSERFSSFNDSVMKSWSVEFGSVSTILKVVIEAQDQSSPSGWSLVTIRLTGVSSLKLCEGPKTSYQVLSNGLHALFDAGRVALEFGDFIDAPESFSELMTSPCHVVAVSLEWDAQFVPQ